MLITDNATFLNETSPVIKWTQRGTLFTVFQLTSRQPQTKIKSWLAAKVFEEAKLDSLKGQRNHSLVSDTCYWKGISSQVEGKLKHAWCCANSYKLHPDRISKNFQYDNSASQSKLIKFINPGYIFTIWVKDTSSILATKNFRDWANTSLLDIQ